MPLAIPATLRTIDIRSVYDVVRSDVVREDRPMRLRPVSMRFASMLFLAMTTSLFACSPFTWSQAAQQNPPHAQPQLPMGGKGGHPTSNITAQVPGPFTITYEGKSAEWTPQK